MTGLYYFYARWYDPQVGRFITKTPFPPFIEHPYAFAENDPINLVDSNGLAATFPNHYAIGYLGGLINGCGYWRSIAFGYAAVWPDIKELGRWISSGSDYSPAVQNAHATAGRLPNGNWQSPEEVYCEVEKIKAQGSLPDALHDIYDWNTYSHAGYPLKGQKWYKHLYWDLFDIEGTWNALKDTVVYLNETGACRW